MNESQPLRGAVARPAITDYGVRTELRLLGVDDSGARYEARWFFGSPATAGSADADAGLSPIPDAHGLATVDPSGEVRIDVQAGEVPEWAQTFTDKLLRTTARGVQGERFPRRLTRWRDGPT